MAQRITSDGRPVELDAAWKASIAQEEVRQAEGAGWRAATLYLWLHTKERRAIVALTDRIRRAVRESGVREGFVLASAMHISAAVYVNDYEAGIMEDMMALLDRLAPYRRDYRHHRTGEDNADAHLKSLLLDCEGTRCGLTAAVLSLKDIWSGTTGGRRRQWHEEP
jgi:secondary thiamine-phosphate synthase enzyme